MTDIGSVHPTLLIDGMAVVQEIHIVPVAEETSLHFEAEHILIPFRICFDIRDAKTDVIEFPLFNHDLFNHDLFNHDDSSRYFLLHHNIDFISENDII